jgi:hypothetical protein
VPPQAREGGQLGEFAAIEPESAATDPVLFRIDIEPAMLATYDFRGQWPRAYRRWKSQA